MALERRSSDISNDANSLTLRSRNIDVEFRHQEKLQGSREHSKQATPRKRRKIGSETGPDANGGASDPPRNSEHLTVLRPKAGADEESRSPALNGFTASKSSPKEDAIGTREPGKQLDTRYQGSSGAAESGRGVHKRFSSEDPAVDARNPAEGPTDEVESELANVQADVEGGSSDDSGDDGAPKTISAKVKQTLPFMLGSKGPKPKKPKTQNSASVDVGPENSAITTGGNGTTNNDSQLSLPIKDALPMRKRARNADDIASRKVKDIIKDGITYRTVSAEGLRSHTSDLLPAKANPGSLKLKERLLVRKRVQDFHHGRRRKFVLGGRS